MLDPKPDAPGNPAVSGQSCCSVQWTSIAWTSGSIICACCTVAAGGQGKSCRHTHTQPLLEKCGVLLGEAAAASGRGLGKKGVQFANKNPPVTRSPVCLAPPRTSSESGSGSRTKVTLWSPPLTRRVRTQLLTRSLSTPRSSSPLREFPHVSSSALSLALTALSPPCYHPHVAHCRGLTLIANS